MINLQKDVLTKVTGSDSISTEVDESTRARLTQEHLGNSYDLSRPVTEIKDKSVHLNGPVCYIEQEPWILSKNVRDNITFKIRDEILNEEHYVNTIKACQLERDLQNFESGDLTLVGDRGIMLSGGQKARISLARAVYRALQLGESDSIVLMDDPVSALDTHVRQMVFE